MKALVIYRFAAVALVLFAIAHTFGFNQFEPSWHLDPLIAAMRSQEFDMMGSRRVLWDLYVALGYSLGAFYLFAAVLAWQLGGLSASARADLRVVRWAFAICFAVIAIVSFGFLFAIPLAFSALITISLAAGAASTR